MEDQEKDEIRARLPTDYVQQVGAAENNVPTAEDSRLTIKLRGAMPNEFVERQYTPQGTPTVLEAINYALTGRETMPAHERTVADEVFAAMHDPRAQVNYVATVLAGGDKRDRVRLNSDQIRGTPVTEYVNPEGEFVIGIATDEVGGGLEYITKR